jgi:hypothetical protein
VVHDGSTPPSGNQTKAAPPQGSPIGPKRSGNCWLVQDGWGAAGNIDGAKRETFSATFFLACLAAMQPKGVVLEEIKSTDCMKRREKWVWILIGVALLIGFLALIPFNGDICEKADNAGHKECAAHGLPVYVAFKVQSFLDFLGVAITAVATIAIAWFTYTLRQSTDRLWKAGDDQLKQIRRSANISERALTELEAPHLSIRIIDNGVVVTHLMPERYDRRRLDYAFVNHGRTPAQIVSYSQKIRAVRPGQGSPPPISEELLDHVPYGFIIPPEGREAEVIGMSCATEIEPEYESLLDDSTNFAFLLVAVRYRDVFGSIYFLSLCYMLDKIHNRFILTGDSAPLNEWRKEKGPDQTD